LWRQKVTIHITNERSVRERGGQVRLNEGQRSADALLRRSSRRGQ
jgi:hypothetical protein